MYINIGMQKQPDGGCSHITVGHTDYTVRQSLDFPKTVRNGFKTNRNHVASMF